MEKESLITVDIIACEALDLFDSNVKQCGMVVEKIQPVSVEEFSAWGYVRNSDFDLCLDSFSKRILAPMMFCLVKRIEKFANGRVVVFDSLPADGDKSVTKVYDCISIRARLQHDDNELNIDKTIVKIDVLCGFLD